MDTLKTCAHCGASFSSSRKDKKYCSNQCKREAYEQRQFEQYGSKMDELEQSVTGKGDADAKTQLNMLKLKLDHEREMFKLKSEQQNTDDLFELQEEYDETVKKLKRDIFQLKEQIGSGDDVDELRNEISSLKEHLKSIREEKKVKKRPAFPDEFEQAFEDFAENFVDRIEEEERFDADDFEELLEEGKQMRKSFKRWAKKSTLSSDKIDQLSFLDQIIAFLEEEYDKLPEASFFSNPSVVLDLDLEKWYGELKSFICYE